MNRINRIRYTQPGKPNQNAYIERFNRTYREELLNQHWFQDLDDARRVIENWWRHYNEVRLHSSLGYLPPRQCAEQAA